MKVPRFITFDCYDTLVEFPIERVTEEILAERAKRIDWPAFFADYERLRPRITRDDYKLLPFTDNFGGALAAADLVVARSGGSVWEVAAAGKPAILVPYPLATADHQAKNAVFFERSGGAITVPETELGRVPELARSLLGDPDRLKEMGEAMKRVARPGAAEEIAEELIALAR